MQQIDFRVIAAPLDQIVDERGGSARKFRDAMKISDISTVTDGDFAAVKTMGGGIELTGEAVEHWADKADGIHLPALSPALQSFEAVGVGEELLSVMLDEGKARGEGLKAIVGSEDALQDRRIFFGGQGVIFRVGNGVGDGGRVDFRANQPEPRFEETSPRTEA